MALSPDIERAVELLRAGGLVALPTETVYGLFARADDELAVRRVFAVKGRPASHPLIVHLPQASALPDWASQVPPQAWKLAEAFWPGPLTLVLSRSARALDVVTGGQDTVALRVPRHPDTRAVLERLGLGVAAPSANRFGKVSPTTAEHVRADLGDDVDFVLDGGPCDVGVESTIVDLSGPTFRLLRPGGVAREELERVLGAALADPLPSSARVPGSLASHYAPAAGVELVTADQLARRAEELLAQGLRVGVLFPPGATAPAGALRLDVPADAAGFARELYAALRRADQQGCQVVLVSPPDPAGLGLAVRDRLARAAAGSRSR